MRTFCIYIMIAMALVSLGSCKKYLDAKSDISREIPSTLADLQAILDNVNAMNKKSPPMGEIGSDDYYVTYTNWQASPLLQREYYIRDANTPASTPDWDNIYGPIEYANTVLDNLATVGQATDNVAAYNNVKGSALFFRSYLFFFLSQEFAPPYNDDNASKPLGICLRLTSDITASSTRSTVQQTYDQIIDDCKEAVVLLPAQALYQTRPSKVAAYSLLARTYLSMRDYTHAGLYADSALQLSHTLMDYNMINAASTYPFTVLNDEVVFHTIGTSAILTQTRAYVDSSLYASYDANDLRRTIFFKNRGFYGSYAGDYTYFTGIATDELYLIRAECRARAGSVADALSDLNTLLVNRWVSGSFTPVNVSDATQLLNIILQERRKELVFRYVRWSDLRRLNQEAEHVVTLTRVLNGTTYTLPPNDLRYTLLIPANVISLAHLQQNPR